MKHHPAIVWRRRVLAAVLAVAATAATAWADAIQFSKPAVAIATPDKEQPSLPRTRSKAFEISSPDQMDAPVAVPPPPMMRHPSRERDDDDDNPGGHPLLRDPDKFPDAVGRDNERNPKQSSSKKRPSGSQSSNAHGKNGKEADDSLSPITNPDWDLRDRDRDHRRKDPFSPNLSSKSDRTEQKERTDRKDSRQKDPYESRQQDESGPTDGFNPGAFDSFAFRPKANPTPAQLEHRAAFDQLLNPSVSSGGPAGSLEPVSMLESPKPGAIVAMPTLGGGVFNKSAASPSEAFKAQPNRPQMPAAENLAKRFSPESKPATPAPVDPHFQSLMRQPTVHDFPTRKF